MVTNPAGGTLYNYVKPLVTGIFGVYFTPCQSGMHLVNVSFNGEVICGMSNCLLLKVKLKVIVVNVTVHGTPSHSSGVSHVIWDHTVLPAPRHK